MRPRPATNRLTDLLLGQPGAERARVRQTLTSLLLHLTYCATHGLAASVGLVPYGVAVALMALYAGQSITFYLLVRSGLSHRIARDPSLTSAQMYVAMVSLVATYTTMTDGHGALISMPLLMLLFGAFGLAPQQTVRMGLAALACLLLAIGWTAWHAAPGAARGTQLFHLSIAVINMLAATALAQRLSQLVQRLRQQKEALTAAMAQIETMARRDALTGLSNRHHLHEVLQQALASSQAQATPWCVGLFDLDLFKSINDRHGHAGGDRVLREFAALAREVVGERHVLGRWGGEEFLLVLAPCPAADGLRLMEQVRSRLARVAVAGLPPGAVTVSGGLAQHRPGEPVEHTLERADQGLYEAKSKGRNLVLSADAAASRQGEAGTAVRRGQAGPAIAAGSAGPAAPVADDAPRGRRLTTPA